ncbi:hypothetical protein V8G54_012549 [Vigna mungo]|uniref:Uncharacterized protein n=1 Tax=Vigna mungo TaxID=3915 RepID=A0AAQ3NT29_VIGMU
MMVKFSASTTSGISPESLFLDRNIMFRFFSMNKPPGISPLKSFCDRSNLSKATMFPMVSGISPTKLQSNMKKNFNLLNRIQLSCNLEGGNKELDDNSKNSRLDKLPISEGILPLNRQF